MKSIINWHLPLKTANEANSSEHWTKKAKRHAKQKKIIKCKFLEENPKIELPCTVVLTRISPRELDEHDNLRVSFKWIVDSIAAELTGNHIPGRADDTKKITWEYHQKKGKPKEYATIIEFISDS